jgi:hypothetical protein
MAKMRMIRDSRCIVVAPDYFDIPRQTTWVFV